MNERIVRIITIESNRRFRGKRKHRKKRLLDLKVSTIIGIRIVWWMLILIALFFLWAALSNKTKEDIYSVHEVTFVDYVQGLSNGEDCTVKVKEVTKSVSITEREYAPRKIVNYEGATVDLTGEEDRGKMIDRAYYWILDDKGNSGVLCLEGAQIDQFEQIKETGELYNTNLYGEIVERSITTGYDIDDIRSGEAEKIDESMALSQELDGQTIMKVNLGMSGTKTVKAGSKTVYPPYFLPALIIAIVLIVLYYVAEFSLKHYIIKSGEDFEESERVFEEISDLLRKRRRTQMSPEEDNMCLFIGLLLGNRAGWYAIHAKTVSEILSFLGVRTRAERNEIYQRIHSPENEAKYGGKDVIFRKKSKIS